MNPPSDLFEKRCVFVVCGFVFVSLISFIICLLGSAFNITIPGVEDYHDLSLAFILASITIGTIMSGALSMILFRR